MKQTISANSSLAQTKQVGKFGLVGILNTLIDFGLYNLFVNLLSFPLIPANLISTTAAMSFSFFANKTYVFKFKQGSLVRQIALFFFVTAFGLYVIQNGVIYTLTEIWHWPLTFGYQIVDTLGLSTIIKEPFFRANGAKVIATGFSFIWNYLLYKKLVFKS